MARQDLAAVGLRPRGAELATLLNRAAAVSEGLPGNWCDTLARVVDRYGV